MISIYGNVQAMAQIRRPENNFQKSVLFFQWATGIKTSDNQGCGKGLCLLSYLIDPVLIFKLFNVIYVNVLPGFMYIHSMCPCILTGVGAGEVKDRISLCGSDCPGTHSIDQADLKL